jgi:ribosomal protein S11
MSGVMGTKRRKKTPQSFEQIIKVIYPYLRLYSIVSIYVYVYRRPNAFYYTLMRLLDHYGMGIKALVARRHVAHNGCRGRKLRRV